MSPDERTALKRVCWMSAIVGWLAWLVFPVSREVALVLLVGGVFAAAGLIGGRD